MSDAKKINFSVSGPENGRRWVFVHGLMGFLNNWKKITGYLDSTEQCLCYDQRGHGRSFKPETGYAPEDYARDLKELTDELGWDRFILVGHSMGGRNALVFASLYPEKVEKLIIEDIGPEANENAHVYYERLLASVPTPFSSREEARDFFRDRFPQVARTKEASQVIGAFLHANLEDKGGVWDWRFYKPGILESVQAGRFRERWGEIQSLKVPTLWIRGESSKELSRETFEKILESNHMIQGVEIPGAGHWVHSEQPLEFVAALKNFAGGF
ncbi:MAG: alpha/beta fold hydrolase [Bdellovibrionales bacterium]